MKKLMMTLAAALTATALLAVESENIVGYDTLTFTNGYNMIALNFHTVGLDGQPALDGIGINDLFDNASEQAWLKAEPFATRANADLMMVWDPSIDTYVTYCYRKNASGVIIGWVKLSDTTQVTTDKIPLGGSVWFVRQAPTNAVLAVAGEVSDGVTVNKSNTFKAGKYNMFGSGFPMDMPLNDARWNWTGAKAEPFATRANADLIMIWDPAVSTYVTYCYRKNASGVVIGWVKLSDTTQVTTDAVKAGQGAWFLRQGATDLVIAEAKPY